MKIRILLAVAFAALASLAGAASLTESTFTEVIKDVNVVTLPARTTQPAKVSELFKAPDLVRTGTDSRTELTAPDQTITRVGANTVFSFEPKGRNVDLEQGSVLFHSPKGKGGGAIKTGGASAAVLGTTLMVSTTTNRGFKTIVLEGKGKVTLANRKSRTLKAGQMVLVLPGGEDFGPTLDINLGKLVAGSKLVTGFSRELASLSLINTEILKQNKALARGRAPTDFASRTGLEGMDENTYQAAVPPLPQK
ncbi:MAG: FecR domain-containing protein [Verrucomicrobia bacterium]|nr:FecR domain-containing protein [Verrucomicrobiota bacterium]